MAAKTLQSSLQLLAYKSHFFGPDRPTPLWALFWVHILNFRNVFGSLCVEWIWCCALLLKSGSLCVERKKFRVVRLQLGLSFFCVFANSSTGVERDDLWLGMFGLGVSPFFDVFWIDRRRAIWTSVIWIDVCRMKLARLTDRSRRRFCIKV